MFNYLSPISYNTPVEQILFRYYASKNAFTPCNYSYFMGWDYPLFNTDFRSLFTNYQFGNNNVINFSFNGKSQTDFYTNVHSGYLSSGEKFKYIPTATTPNKTNESNITVDKQTKNCQKPDLNAEFLKVANKYSNCKESDNSHLKFCVNESCKTEDPGNQEWCTDFVTYVVKESYSNKGGKVPEWFGEHDVRRLKNKAINNGSFIDTSKKSQKGDYIAKNIKPGDIFILNENGASHTGFVTEVLPDGRFKTIEGNRYDKVGYATYSPDYNQLSGFIRLTS